MPIIKQWSLSIRGGLVLGPAWIPKSSDAQVPQLALCIRVPSVFVVLHPQIQLTTDHTVPYVIYWKKIHI